MQKTVYLDTTIPSYLFDIREEVKFQITITKRWFEEEAENFQIYVSEATINELNAGNYPNKEQAVKFLLQYEILPYDDDIRNIAEVYIQNYVMPKDAEGDLIIQEIRESS